MNKKYQIFVSSTYNDLRKERQVAIDTIMKLRQIPAGMELFSATGENQFEMIKPIIYESDYYLLIVGGKYGTICEQTGLSYTEMEYDFAIQNHKRIIAFVHDDPDNLSSGNRELSDKMRRKLKKFRRKVMNNKMVKMWHDQSELFQSISISISTVVEMYPSNTCWLHVDENDIYTPIGDYIALDNKLEIPMNENIELYYNNMDEKVLGIEKETGKICLSVDMSEKQVDKSIDEFAGCCIRMPVDIRDWSRYVLNDYYLLVEYCLSGTAEMPMWVEAKGNGIEMCKMQFQLSSGKNGQVSIYLKDFMEDLDDWKKVREICLVFRPQNKAIAGKVDIYDVRIENR